MRPGPPATALTSTAPPPSLRPNAGYRSTEQAAAATRTTVVKRDPAPPSTSPCDAFRSKGSHAGAPAAWLGAAGSDGLGCVDAPTDGGTVAAGEELALDEAAEAGALDAAGAVGEHAAARSASATS